MRFRLSLERAGYMYIALIVFLVLIIIVLFSIRKPSRRMLSAENLADDLLGTSNNSQSSPRMGVSNKEINFANVLAAISASIKLAMRDKGRTNKDLADDREQIKDMIQNIEKENTK